MISVIVPIYQVEEYIHRCVDSILAQSFTDFELILVDDGSPDNCGKICDEYVKLDKRVTVIHKDNGGLSDARNAGIVQALKNTSSEWITFIDSDDWIHPMYLELLYNCVVNNKVFIAVCSFQKAESEGSLSLDLEFKTYKLKVEDFFISYNTIATITCAKLYKKDLFKNIRFPSGRIHEDEFITYKLLFRFSEIIYIDYPLYYYFTNTNGIMGSKRKSIKRFDAVDALEEQYQFFKGRKQKTVLNYVVKKYIWLLVDCFNILKNYRDSKENQRLYKKIRKRMRKCLQSTEDGKSIKGNERAYEIAYPYLMKLYYNNRRIKKRIRRLFF